MPAFTIIVVAAFGGLVLGSMLVPGAPFLALPLAALGIAVIGAGTFRLRVRRARDPARLREAAGEEPAIRFTERDRETLLPSARDSQWHR
jgi:hypothetical protein